ncbi:hypothetical protein C0991_007279 [Blastosporella zonata]|nr:hypothetical protein C0991_007279 [Blastosporella zonata]
MAGNWGLIDLETPKEAYTKPSYTDPAKKLQLVFSDEFNTDGRTFYPGDDPYWEAVDLHYWAWPYTYDSCDVGTVANQSVNGLPVSATINGDTKAGGALSYLPGQRLSRCTCPGEAHPGPMHQDGTFVGRSAPEIDVFEAQVVPNGYVSSFSADRIKITGNPPTGQISQSAQWAVSPSLLKELTISDRVEAYK